MTDVPEHLLRRSKERRAALGKGGDAGADPGAGASADAGGGATDDGEKIPAHLLSRSATAAGGGGGTATATATMTPTRTPTPQDAATGAPASASDQDTATPHPPSLAVDGTSAGQDPNTYWSTGTNGCNVRFEANITKTGDMFN